MAKYKPQGEKTQMPMFTPESKWRPPKIDDLPIWRNIDAKRIGLDIETCDPYLRDLGPSVRRGGYITGFSLAIEDGPSWYVPIKHQGGDNVENPEGAITYLKDQAKHCKQIIVGANLGYDLDYLQHVGVNFNSGVLFRDVLIADPLIYELEKSYSLNNVAKRHGLEGKDEVLLKAAAEAYGIDPKKDMWRLPARYVGEYAAEDAQLPLQLLRRQERIIDDNDLWQIYDLESQLLPVLIKMRARGVRIDQDKLTQIEHWALSEEQKLIAEIDKRTGYNIGIDNCWKAGILAEVLKIIGVKVGKTPKGKPKVDKVVLANTKHPVGDLILKVRKVNKLRTTFASSVRRYMVNGRLHPILNQVKFDKDDDSGDTQGAAYGRMSCAHPNIQQQPSRDEFADEWRSIYLPEEGAIWACNDYSQQEPRWTTHFAEITNCSGAKTMGDAYRTDPNTDNHDMMTTIIDGITRAKTSHDEFEKRRKFCKNIYLGLCYGMGGAKLARSIGLPTRFLISCGWDQKFYANTIEKAKLIAAENEGAKIWEVAGKEAQEILDKFDSNAPFVRQLAKKVECKAKRVGYIKTALGRHCHFPVDGNGNYDWTHKALNRLIQGSSGDQTKKALIELDREGYFIHFPVHDEANISTATVEEAQAAAKIMAECVPMRVPSKVDCEVGPSWGEVK